MMKYSFIYIVTNRRNGALYIGVTNDLERRISEHRCGFYKGFTSKYKINKLVCYEVFEDIEVAIEREKELKKWCRKWKLDLIEETNPEWNDLYFDLIDE